jgi:hypothetical protein
MRKENGPPTGGLQKALFVLHMHWWKDRTTDEARTRHIRELRRQCQAFLKRTEKYQT